jgi:hypothetical protein
MFCTDSCRCVLSKNRLSAAVAMVVSLALGVGVAWGVTGAIDGSATPVLTDNVPALGDIYEVSLVLSNKTQSTSTPPNPVPGTIGNRDLAVTVTSARLSLACITPGCGPGTGLPGVVTFFPTVAAQCEVGSDACVTGCIPAYDPVSGADTVDLILNNCNLGPGEADKLLAIIRVRQTALPLSTFSMHGEATYEGTAGSCSGAPLQCTNVALNNTCSGAGDCDFTSVVGTVTGEASLTPNTGAPCGHSISGTIWANATGGTSVGGARISACPTPADTACRLTSSLADGSYALNDLPDSTCGGGAVDHDWNVVVNPPGGSGLGPGTAGPITVNGSDVHQDVILLPLTPLPPGASISTPSGGTVIAGTPTVFWQDPINLFVTGCPGGIASTATLLAGDGYSQTVSPLLESSPGIYTGSFAPPAPHHGSASISWSITCASSTVTGQFDIYIDPSGIVQTTTGARIGGATVILFLSDDSSGPFTQVPDGSPIMSPGNQTNPDLTGATGHFGWDVLPGFYKVRAGKAGCTDPGGGSFVETPVLTIPPPVTDLRLVLSCPVTPADLSALVESMDLDRGLANELTNKARQAARVANGKNACQPLDNFARRVVDEAGNEKPKLTSAQARTLLNELYLVEFADGCRAVTSTLPAVEAAVVDLIDIINDLGLPKGLANDLRNKASEAGKQAATDDGNPCRQLDELLRTATRRLTPAQLAAITAAVRAVQSELAC